MKDLTPESSRGCTTSVRLGSRAFLTATRTGAHVVGREPAKRHGDAETGARKVGFDVSATFRNQTEHFKVYYDDDLGGTLGPEVADAILSVCEADLGTLAEIFGSVPLPNLPISVIAVPWSKAQGAYHYGCDGTEIYCGVIPTPACKSPWSRECLLPRL